MVNVKSLPFNLNVMTLEQIVRFPECMRAISCYCETLHLRLPCARRYRGSLSARGKSFSGTRDLSKLGMHAHIVLAQHLSRELSYRLPKRSAAIG
jgi:hypothetical protein